MSFWREEFMRKRRREWLAAIDKVQVKVGGVYHDGEIQRCAVEGETVVVHAVFGAIGADTVTITAVRIVDVDGEVAAERFEEITKSGSQGVVLRFVFPIRQETEGVAA